MIRAGARIVNARGVPGTLACVVRSLSDGAPMLLTAHHVLFGAGARALDALFCNGGVERDGLIRIGVARYGRFGTVIHEGASTHIDCAVASLDEWLAATIAPFSPDISAGRANVGDRVTKVGAGTGLTSGIVVDDAFDDTMHTDGRTRIAPRQLLIRSLTPHTPFSGAGDSGAMILNASAHPVGLLTGLTAAGDAVACHIAPVLRVLHLALG